jgi:hypothetical protein
MLLIFRYFFMFDAFVCWREVFKSGAAQLNQSRCKQILVILCKNGQKCQELKEIFL